MCWKERKDSLETRAILLLELEISGVAVESIYHNSDDFCEELLSENDLEAVLPTFFCYDHDVKASETFQKIAADQREYRKCSSCVMICRIAKIYLLINNSEKWLVTRIPPT